MSYEMSYEVTERFDVTKDTSFLLSPELDRVFSCVLYCEDTEISTSFESVYRVYQLSDFDKDLTEFEFSLVLKHLIDLNWIRER